MTFAPLSTAEILEGANKRWFIGAYGSEDRALGWMRRQEGQRGVLDGALMFRYRHTKGNRNRITDAQRALSRIALAAPRDVVYDARRPFRVEAVLANAFAEPLSEAREIVLDISAMTKLLILTCLCSLRHFSGAVRVVYSEAEDYVPTREDYEQSKGNMGLIARVPSRGVQAVVRTECLSSVRMQGQPVTLVAFTSFNEQLVRHMLGTISPHRLLFINGRPPRPDYTWRERATQEIHQKLIDQYPTDNRVDERGWLTRVASTLDYRDTIDRIEEIYRDFGIHERIICAATGSKMQTVGLFFAKVLHPDIHVEYPTPDSYFVRGASTGVCKVHEIVMLQFASYLETMGDVAA